LLNFAPDLQARDGRRLLQGRWQLPFCQTRFQRSDRIVKRSNLIRDLHATIRQSRTQFPQKERIAYCESTGNQYRDGNQIVSMQSQEMLLKAGSVRVS
jgi:hypothetical protein